MILSLLSLLFLEIWRVTRRVVCADLVDNAPALLISLEQVEEARDLLLK